MKTKTDLLIPSQSVFEVDLGVTVSADRNCALLFEFMETRADELLPLVICNPLRFLTKGNTQRLKVVVANPNQESYDIEEGEPWCFVSTATPCEYTKGRQLVVR